jgi:ATP-dependent Clp protease ATP-binding subunit ClpB
VDDNVIFNPLGREQLDRIIDLQLGHLRALLADRKITIELSEKARELLFSQGFEPAYGARPMKRALQRLIQNPLAKKILAGEVLPGDSLLVDAPDGSIRFERVPAKALA